MQGTRAVDQAEPRRGVSVYGHPPPAEMPLTLVMRHGAEGTSETHEAPAERRRSVITTQNINPRGAGGMAPNGKQQQNINPEDHEDLTPEARRESGAEPVRPEDPEDQKYPRRQKTETWNAGDRNQRQPNAGTRVW